MTDFVLYSHKHTHKHSLMTLPFDSKSDQSLTQQLHENVLQWLIVLGGVSGKMC